MKKEAREKRKSGKNFKRAAALCQIFIFVLSSFAFSFIIGGGVLLGADESTGGLAGPGETVGAPPSGSVLGIDTETDIRNDQTEILEPEVIWVTPPPSIAPAVAGTSAASNFEKNLDLDYLQGYYISEADGYFSKGDYQKAASYYLMAAKITPAGEEQDNLNNRAADYLAISKGEMNVESLEDDDFEWPEVPDENSDSMRKEPSSLQIVAETSQNLQQGTTPVVLDEIDKIVLGSLIDNDVPFEQIGNAGKEALKKLGITNKEDYENYKIDEFLWSEENLPPTIPPGGVTKPTGFGPEKYSIFNFDIGTWGEGSGAGHIFASALSGLGHGLGVLTAISTLTNIGILPKEYGTPLANAAFFGIIAGETTSGIIKYAVTNSEGWWARYMPTISWVAGLLTAYMVFASKYTKTEVRESSVEFKCMPWQAPHGGADCNKCNTDVLRPCSEYRCKSLGQTCKLINAGTGLDKCIDSSPNDVTSPGIKPDRDVITNGYDYSDVKERPPGGNGPAGMRIINSKAKDGCLKAFNPFTFGIITTDIGGVTQPAQCKIEYNHTAKFDDMQYYLSDTNAFIEKHNQTIGLPGTDMLNRIFPEIKNDGEYTVYIRCKDGNGNENRDEFAVRFCIDKTPDTSAPIIKATSLPTGSPVPYHIDNVTIGVYTNEPAKCRWSRKDASYSNMENPMECNNNIEQMNAEFLYTCATTLTAIKDKETNNFYFACQDLINNTMNQNYKYSLIGTQPITILNVGPSGTIGSSTSIAVVNITARTDNGFKNGEATCQYSTSSDESSYVTMFDTTNKNAHSQSLDLASGDYTYYFKCFDAGGNTAYNQTNFTVYVDRQPPLIIRAYSLENKLIITTDEDSECRYSTDSCNFDLSKSEGTAMPFPGTIHYAEWKASQSYYIKCADSYNNQPDPAACSVILRPYAILQAE